MWECWKPREIFGGYTGSGKSEINSQETRVAGVINEYGCSVSVEQNHRII